MAIADYLRKLVEMKNQLVANLNSMGVTADESEKLNTLVPKVLEAAKGEQNVEWVDSPSGDFYYGATQTKKLIVPEGITSISYNSSYPYTNLEELYLPSTLTSISSYLMFNSTSLNKIVFPANSDVETSLNTLFSDNNLPVSEATIILPASGNGVISDSLFSSNTNISKVIIESGITSIGSSAFSGCTSLTGITIPGSVTSIGTYAFQDCANLTNILLPDSITSIGEHAFRNCSGLTSIVIPNNGLSIGERAFEYCTGLTSITIPESVINIGSLILNGCEGLETIEVSENNPNYCSIDGVFFDKGKTTLLQYSLGNARQEYTIPDNVTTIGTASFEKCKKLISITIPNSITNINDWAFAYCTNIENIYYAGTEEQWNAITKGNYWNYGMGSNVSGGTVIHYNYTG